MTLHADIRLDFNNMMSDAVGEAGLGRGDVDALRPQASQIHRGLNDLKKLGQLPFLDLPFQEDMLRRVVGQARDAASRFRRVLLLGIGGSALGPRLLAGALGTSDKTGRSSPTVLVCDSVDSQDWVRIAEWAVPEETLLVAVSKSGKTLETWAALVYFLDRFRLVLGDGMWRHVVAITDPHAGPLRKLAEEKQFPALDIPAGVGGRFSVLSCVGLFPAVLAGADAEALLGGARRMEERCRTDDPWLNPALMSAVLHERFETLKKRNVRVLLSYGEGLKDYPPWFAQLWAESLGKPSLGGGGRPVGSTPVGSTGPRDQHSQLQLYLDGPQDKTVTLLGVEEASREERLPASSEWIHLLTPETTFLENRSVHEILAASRAATEEALRGRGRPNQTILLKRLDAHSLGQLLMMAELETVYAGQLLGVNPFDQPAVEQIKQNVRDFLNGRITPPKSRNYMI